MVSILKTDKIQASHGSTIEIPSGHNLHAPGHAIQTVQSKWYTVSTTTSTSYIAVDDSQVNITPKYANSQFLIRYALHQYCRNNTQHGLKPYFYVPSIGSWSALTSNSTFNEIVRVANGSTNLVIWSMQHFEFLVGVPGNGTEQVSFKIYHRTADANYSVRINFCFCGR